MSLLDERALDERSVRELAGQMPVDYFVASGRYDARRLAEHCGLSSESVVLDLGCGFGRLAVGITEEIGLVRRYLGMDIRGGCIEKCRRNIHHLRGFSFETVLAQNERYNRNAGECIGEGFRLRLESSYFDIAYLYSVIAHLRAEEAGVYFRELRRVLKPGGSLFFTTFVEEDVPAWEENPSGYHPDPGKPPSSGCWPVKEWKGPLHCCRYEKGFLFGLLRSADFEVYRFEHQSEGDGQSAIYAR